MELTTEVIYAVGAVAVSVLGALRLSRCTRVRSGCIEVERDVGTRCQAPSDDELVLPGHPGEEKRPQA